MSVIDEKMESLDPTIWGRSIDRTHVLRPEVAATIRRRARELLHGIPVRGAYLVGSMTGYYYKPDSDLDVSLILDTSDESLLALREQLRDINGKNIPGTKHPLNFFLLNEPVNFNRFDGVYDLRTDVWRKIPTEQGVDLFSVYDDFKGKMSQIDAEVGEAWRAVIDIKILRDSLRYGGSKHIYSKLKRRIDDLDEAVNNLSEEYDSAHQARLDAFKRQLELAELGQSPYPSPNLLPANIRYKILERYHYLDFMKKLNQLLEESGGKIDTKQDLQDVHNILTMKDNESVRELSSGFLTKAVKRVVL